MQQSAEEPDFGKPGPEIIVQILGDARAFPLEVMLAMRSSARRLRPRLETVPLRVISPSFTRTSISEASMKGSSVSRSQTSS